MMHDESDRLLIARVRDRNAGAWQQLIDRFEGRLMAYVDSRLGDRARAEDVVQETFLGFLISLPNYDETTPLETFLFSIAAHKLTDVLRREGRRPTVSLSGSTATGTAGSTAGQEPAGSARRASTIARSREGRQVQAALLAEALGGLIARWKERRQFERLQCIELLFVLGWPNKSVAEHLGISEQAVAQHKHQTISQLRQMTAGRQALDLREFGLA